MRPINSKPGPSPLTRQERRGFLIDFLAWQARRDRPGSRERHVDVEARLVAAGIDPWWSWSEFKAWLEEGG